MQDITPELQAELDKGQSDPRVLVDLYEFYDHDYIPGVNGFDPADAVEQFAAEEITWDGIAYRREVVSRGDIVRSVGEKTNSVTVSFSNISRYLATLAQSTEIEGLFLVIRCIAPIVTNDSLVLFVGRCDKPSDIDKKSFSLTARQDFGDINQTVPPDRFQTDDPEGRLPSDPLFEGIPFTAINGSITFPRVEPSTSFLGRLFGRRRTVYVTQQWSSVESTPLGSVIPECFGRVQMELIPIMWVDRGGHVGYLMAACKGPIAGMDNIQSRTEGWTGPLCNFQGTPGSVHLGDPGGTGTNQGSTCQPTLAPGLFFSHLAYVAGASLPDDPEAAVEVADQPPTLTAIIRGRIVPLPDANGVYNQSGWTDNPVHIARFILTSAKWVNINSAFMEDAVNYLTALHCDYPLVDETNTQVIPVVGPDINQAGSAFRRYLPTGNIDTRYLRFRDFGDTIIPEFEDGPYVGVDLGDPLPDPSDTTDPSFISQKPLRKRYTANFPITEEIRAVDLLHNIVFPAAKLFMRVNKFGRYEIRSEQPSDSTHLRTATSIGATSIPLLDITPWKSGPDLLQGRILLGFGLTTSEVRTPSAAVYSTSGNAVTLAAGSSGGVAATASGGTLTGGSTTVQASGTITIGGTPASGNTVTATIDGIAVTYILDTIDTTGTAAGMLAYYINANQRLNKYIRATWDSGTPTVITITCLHGDLTVSALLKAHAVGIADPSSAPTVAAAAGALAAGTYKVAYADVTAIGSTALTPLASVVLTASQQIDVSSLPALTGTSRDFYISEKANSTNLRFVASRTDNANFSINSLPLPGSAIPPSSNTTAEELIRVAKSFATNSQDLYPAWSASTAVILNDIYLPTALNGHKYRVSTAGTTASTEPTWPTGAGATVASGSAVFTEDGSTVLQQAGLTRANVKKDSFKWPLGSRQSSVNQIKGNFRDAKNDFALTPFKYNDRTHQAQVKKTYPLEMDLSAVDSVHQVARIAGWALSKNREGDWFNSLATGPDGLVLEEGDVICASDDSGGLINVVSRIEDLRIQPNHDVVINQARRYSTLMFSDDVGAHRIPVASTLRFVQTKDSLGAFIDTPPIRVGDAATPGFYLAVNHDLDIEGDWRGWALYADFGDGYTFLAEGDIANSAGTATTTLGTVTNIVPLDTINSVTFTLDYVDPVPGFSTVTSADLVANPYRNLFLVGNEYVQAATITDNGNRSFTISNLYRGRFDTKWDELTHTASEKVVFINGAAKFIPMDLSRLDVAYNYKVVTINQDLADATPISFTWRGYNFRAPRPALVEVIRDGNGDWTIDAFLFSQSHDVLSASLVAEVWTSASRTSPDTNRKARLIVPPAITFPLIPISAGSSKTFRGDITLGGGSTYSVAHTNKNNMQNGQWTIQGVTGPWSRVDFNMHWGHIEDQLGVFNPWQNPLDDPPNQATLTDDYFQVYLWYGEPHIPPSGTVVGFPLIGIKWSAGIIPNTITENFFKYTNPTIAVGANKWTVTQTRIATRDAVDPGVGAFRKLDTDPVDAGRPGPRYSFVVASNEIRIYAGIGSSGTVGLKPIAVVPFIPKPTPDGTHPLNALEWPFPLHLYIRVSTGEATVAWCRNMILGGGSLGSHRVVYSAREQMAQFGSLQTKLYLRLAQLGTSPFFVDGIPLDVETPDLA